MYKHILATDQSRWLKFAPANPFPVHRKNLAASQCGRPLDCCPQIVTELRPKGRSNLRQAGGGEIREGVPPREHQVAELLFRHGKLAYTFSRNYGNTEGQLLSEVGQRDVPQTHAWDIPN